MAIPNQDSLLIDRTGVFVAVGVRIASKRRYIVLVDGHVTSSSVGNPSVVGYQSDDHRIDAGRPYFKISGTWYPLDVVKVQSLYRMAVIDPNSGTTSEDYDDSLVGTEWAVNDGQIVWKDPDNGLWYAIKLYETGEYYQVVVDPNHIAGEPNGVASGDGYSVSGGVVYATDQLSTTVQLNIVQSGDYFQVQWQ